MALLPSLGCANDGQRASDFSDDTVRRLDAAIAKQMKENDLPEVDPDQPLLLENPQCLTQRGAAHPELASKRLLTQRAAVGYWRL